MIFFSSKKPFLKDLIPTNFVDIHSHVLFGIDDGAKTIEDSKYLLTEMKNLGFSKVITTPHTIANVWKNTPESITQKHTEVIQKLPNETKALDLKCASEYLMDDEFLLKVKENKILPLKDNFVLVEMSYINPPMQLFDIIFELQLAGYVPVLAHPERYVFYHNNLEHYEKLKKAGCYFQVNLLSTVGYYGEPVAKMAQKLLEKEMIDFVGSDIHHKNHIEAFQKRILFKNTETLARAFENNAYFG